MIVTLLPRDGYQRTLFVALILFLIASCIAAPYRQYLLMQHVPTMLAIALLGWLSNRIALSRFSYALVILFLTLHTLGARYLYSYTPYDQWSQAVLGTSISETFGFERNHYDRLVHFCWGLLLAIPIAEVEQRYLKLSTWMASLLSIECILATSAAYELLEWLIALVFAADWAESFLGLQGDPFDAQKDMALATLGAAISLALRGAWILVRSRRAHQSP